MKQYCDKCGRECDAIERDVGIGHYEFWGTKGHDQRIIVVSSCCQAEVCCGTPPDKENEGKDARRCTDCWLPLAMDWDGERCGICTEKRVTAIVKRDRDKMTDHLIARIGA